MKARRWLCDACQREWLPNGSAMGAQPWSDADGCPSCHSQQIREVEFSAAFPGADIPRAPQPSLMPDRLTFDYSTPPPTVLVSEQPVDLWQFI